MKIFREQRDDDRPVAFELVDADQGSYIGSLFADLTTMRVTVLHANGTEYVYSRVNAERR